MDKFPVRIERAAKSLRISALFVSICLVWLSGFALKASANDTPDPRGLVIVMNQNVDISSIDDDELRKLFTGKISRLPNGARAVLASYEPESSFFNQKLLGLSDAEVNALWSRLRFSGRTPPPRTFKSVQALLDFVASTPNALAYMPASATRLGLRVITNLPR